MTAHPVIANRSRCSSGSVVPTGNTAGSGRPACPASHPMARCWGSSGARWTSPIFGVPRKRCGRPTSARTSSWRPWPTNCEIRWPQSATSLHILRLDRGGETAEQVYDMLERQVDQMVRLVDDLLEVSRITRGKIELRRERVELGAVIRSALETSKPLIDAAGHELTVEHSHGTRLARRRSRAAVPGLRQPAQQRRQVHRTRREGSG